MNDSRENTKYFLAGVLWTCGAFAGVFTLAMVAEFLGYSIARFVAYFGMLVWVFAYMRCGRITRFFIRRALKMEAPIKNTPLTDKKLAELLAATKKHRINADWLAFGNFNNKDVAKILDALMAYLRWKAGNEKK